MKSFPISLALVCGIATQLVVMGYEGFTVSAVVAGFATLHSIVWKGW